ncbi:DUF1653 domain-containing protein [Pseudomaricurvus alkylphenolicus]|uniref:DUF1653 domain-containing protein n=1 Tax=Pseudomaricurvus alkylphenolicus TaxID=1306991 RepID=UPI0019801D0C|nr:DUF1653 domain-containing protein [Pseudomaricurvus alkylphenolicus]
MQAGVYRHYKGSDYQVFNVAHHSETEEALVVYRCLYGDYSWWVRPLEMFAGSVEFEGERRERFAYQGAFEASQYPEAPVLAFEGV